MKRVYGPYTDEAEHLRRRVKAAEESLSRLEKDASGALEIVALKEENKRLQAKLDETAKREEKQRRRADKLACEVKALKEELSDLKHENRRLGFDISVAHSEWKEQERNKKAIDKSRLEWKQKAQSLGKKLKDALDENKHLKAKANKTSLNSSLPPSSSTTVKPILNSRIRSGKPKGGQPGHKGAKRTYHKPTDTFVLPPLTVCPHCGNTNLKDTGATVRTRRLTDIVIQVKTTEWHSQSSWCPNCNEEVYPPFPTELKNEENYGTNIQTFLSYLTDGLNVSIDNARNFLYELTAGEINVSKGYCAQVKRVFESRAQAHVNEIFQAISQSPYVGVDATHMRSCAHMSYIYNYNTPYLAYYQASDKKGDTPLMLGPLKNSQATIIGDHDRTYYAYGSEHGECNAHILRYLKGAIENEPHHQWAKDMICVLNDALRIAKEAINKEGFVSEKDYEEISKRYDSALEKADAEYLKDGSYNSKYKPEGIALFKRMKKYKDNHLLFLKDINVPFTNNATERLLRCAKGKLKQAGGFRSTETGEAPYCSFLTITKTSQLQGKSPYLTVLQIFRDPTQLNLIPSDLSLSRAIDPSEQ